MRVAVVAIKPPRGEGLPQAAGRMLTGGELSALLNICRGDPSPAGCRDACMLGLAAYAGCAAMKSRASTSTIGK